MEGVHFRAARVLVCSPEIKSPRGSSQIPSADLSFAFDGGARFQLEVLYVFAPGYQVLPRTTSFLPAPSLSPGQLHPLLNQPLRFTAPLP